MDFLIGSAISCIAGVIFAMYDLARKQWHKWIGGPLFSPIIDILFLLIFFVTSLTLVIIAKMAIEYSKTMPDPYGFIEFINKYI